MDGIISVSLMEVNSESQIHVCSVPLSNSGMDTVDSIRLAKLEKAIARMGSIEALAEAAGLSAAYISQVRNELPDSKTGTPKRLGRIAARKIETALEEERGWMDSAHTGDLAAFVDSSLSDEGKQKLAEHMRLLLTQEANVAAGKRSAAYQVMIEKIIADMEKKRGTK